MFPFLRGTMKNPPDSKERGIDTMTIIDLVTVIGFTITCISFGIVIGKK